MEKIASPQRLPLARSRLLRRVALRHDSRLDSRPPRRTPRHHPPQPLPPLTNPNTPHITVDSHPQPVGNSPPSTPDTPRTVRCARVSRGHRIHPSDATLDASVRAYKTSASRRLGDRDAHHRGRPRRALDAAVAPSTAGDRPAVTAGRQPSSWDRPSSAPHPRRARPPPRRARAVRSRRRNPSRIEGVFRGDVVVGGGERRASARARATAMGRV